MILQNEQRRKKTQKIGQASGKATQKPWKIKQQKSQNHFLV
jgi:hypothetical protein